MMRDKPKRRHDIDWLRVLAMLTIFLFHCARFFNYEDWHVKNNELSLGMSVFVGIIGQWIMPLFFVISGMSTFYALGFRTKGEFIMERFRRLLIPFLFGTFIILIPVQVWIERVSHGDFSGPFLKFYPHYFDGYYALGGNFAWMGLHLWFLEFLFIFSFITLPLFLYFRKKKMQNLISGLADFIKKPGFVFLLAFPIIIMELIVNLQPEGIGMRRFGGWSLATYLVFFISGYIIASDPGFRDAMEKQRIASLFLIMVLTPVPLGFVLDKLRIYDPVEYFLIYGLYALGSWAWIVAIFGFGSKYLAFNNRILKYGNEAVLPFYVLHQTVIVVIGFQIAHWEIGVLLKYSILGASSFAVIMILYEFFIRRINLMRFLFGMKS